MSDTIILCSDGSELATRALTAGLALLRPGASLALVSVLEPLDPTLVTGTGFAGGMVAPEVFEANEQDRHQVALTELEELRGELGLTDASVTVLQGDPGVSLCAHAEEIGAAAIVLGSRGRGGLRRAVLGSVSDHVVRHAPCPVIVTAHPD